jgi:Ni/Fe-hydrogenase subunit HybB-like protein
MLYNVVLFLEFIPAVFERLKWNIPLRLLHMIEIPLIIAGIVISTGHQNSLGSMLLLMGNDLNHMYYTPILPLLFFLHAVSVGPAMVLFETTISSKVFGHHLDIDILSGVGKILRIPLFLYLAFRVGDLILAGEIGGLFDDFPTAIWLWIELIIGGVLPLILFSIPSIQKSRGGLFVTAIMVILGLIVTRFSYTLMSLSMRPGYGTYFPHPAEIAISVGLVAAGMFVIMLANKFLPIMKNGNGHGEHGGQPAEAAAGA